jgi:hypothetical protein
MSPHLPKSERLYEHFAAIAGGSITPPRAQLNRLRVDIWRVIDELRATGESPERTISFIKRVAISAGLSERHDAIVALILPWCIEYFFGTTVYSRRDDRTRIVRDSSVSSECVRDRRV